MGVPESGFTGTIPFPSNRGNRCNLGASMSSAYRRLGSRCFPVCKGDLGLSSDFHKQLASPKRWSLP
jgi:hypothetical protein